MKKSQFLANKVFFQTIRLASLLIAICSSSIVYATIKDISSTCNVASIYDDKTDDKNNESKINTGAPVSLEYINDETRGAYNAMRNSVINNVKKEVVLSLLDLSVDGFAPENIASYVSDATKPFLPFEFANNVKIIGVTHKEGTIVYKAEVPIHRSHDHAIKLIKAGIASATDTICNDSKMVEGLLERNIVIQYDYYDMNGLFICSFNIKEGH